MEGQIRYGRRPGRRDHQMAGCRRQDLRQGKDGTQLSALLEMRYSADLLRETKLVHRNDQAERSNWLPTTTCVNWFPDFVGEKRFGNWLENVNDWAISRNRYWGTPIPIWRCECGHLECIGSRAELVEKAQEDITEDIELHRPYVDDVHLTCPVAAASR